MANLNTVLKSATALAKQYKVPLEKAKWVIAQMKAGTYPKTAGGLSAAFKAYAPPTAVAPAAAGLLPKAAAVDKTAIAEEAFSTQRAHGYARGVARGVRYAPAKEGAVSKAFRGFGELFGRSKTPVGYETLEKNLSNYVRYILKPEQAAQAIPLLKRRLPEFAEVVRLAGAKIPSGSLSAKEVLKLQTATMETAVQGTLAELKLLGESTVSKAGAHRMRSLGKIAGTFGKTDVGTVLAEGAASKLKAPGPLSDPTGLLKDTMVKGGTGAKVIGMGAGLLAATKLSEGVRTRAAIPGIEKELRETIQTPEQILRDLKAQELMMLRDARLQGELQGAAGGNLQSCQPDRTMIPGAAYYSEQGGPNNLDLEALMGGAQ